MNSLADIAAAMESDCDFDTLLEGMRRQTMNIWRGIGITIKMRELSSWPERERAYNRAYGDSLISDVQCRMRSWFFPERQRILVKAYERAKLRVQAEMLNAIMESGREAMDEQPG